jgi:hypothetical protein
MKKETPKSTTSPFVHVTSGIQKTVYDAFPRNMMIRIERLKKLACEVVLASRKNLDAISSYCSRVAAGNEVFILKRVQQEASKQTRHLINCVDTANQPINNNTCDKISDLNVGRIDGRRCERIRD